MYIAFGCFSFSLQPYTQRYSDAILCTTCAIAARTSPNRCNTCSTSHPASHVVLKSYLQDQWVKLASVWDKLNVDQLTQLESLSSTSWDTLIAQLPVEDLVALSPELQITLDIGEKIVERLKGVTLADVSKWGDKQWSRAIVDNLASMNWSVLQQVPITELQEWTEVRHVAFISFCCFVLLLFLFHFY